VNLMAPSSENNPAIVPDEASTGEMISGLSLSGQPHAGNPQPYRLFLPEVGADSPPLYPGRTAAISWRGAGLTMGRPSITTVGTVSLPPATERTKAAASGSRQMLTFRTER
jgi:hypothetical protein